MNDQLCPVLCSQRGWYDSEENYYLLMFSIAMCLLRCVSFSLELCWSPLQDRRTNHDFSFLNFLTQLYDLVSYCFYHPLFYNGPIINYNHFSQQVSENTQIYLLELRLYTMTVMVLNNPSS